MDQLVTILYFCSLHIQSLDTKQSKAIYLKETRRDTFKQLANMSDKETEDDVGLPKATVFKLIQGPSTLCPPEGSS
jgi:hypothetical protein